MRRVLTFFILCWAAGAQFDLCAQSEAPPRLRTETHARSERKKLATSEPVETALKEFAEKCTPVRKKLLEEHMSFVLKSLEESAKLTEAEKAKLQAASDAAITKTLEIWKPAFIEACRPYVDSVQQSTAVRYVTSWKPETATPYEPVENCPLPDESTEFLQALKDTLDAPRLAAWEKTARERKDARLKEIDEYLVKWQAGTLPPVEKKLAAQTTEFVEHLKLDAPKTKSVEAAVKTTLTALADAQKKTNREMLSTMTDAGWKNQKGRSKFYIPFDAPAEVLQKELEKQLVSVLDATQVASFKNLKEEKETKLKREIVDKLTSIREQYRENHTNILQVEADNIVAMLGLPDDRAKQVKGLVTKSLDTFFEQWQAQMVERMQKLSEEDQERVAMGNMGLSVNLEGQDNALEMKAWKDNLKAMLTPEEFAKLAANRDKMQNDQINVLTRLTISTCDARLALSTAQREKLEPVLKEYMIKWIKDHGVNFQNGMSLSSSYVLSNVKTLEEKKVRPLLTDSQWKIWQTLSQNDSSHNRAKPKSDDEKKKEEEKGESAEDELDSVEFAVSTYIHEKVRLEKEQRYKALQLQVEEASAIGKLTPEASTQLHIAAKGAVETTIGFWQNNMERWIRSQMSSATPASVQQQLAGLGNVSFGRQGGQPQDAKLWTDAVVKTLSPETRKLWLDEQAARKRYRSEAIAQATLTELARVCPVSKEQADKLLPLVSAVVEDYAPEFLNWFSEDWYFQSYYIMVPLGGVDENALKDIFPGKQLEHFKTTGLARALEYWGSIQQQRDARRKNEEAEAAAK